MKGDDLERMAAEGRQARAAVMQADIASRKEREWVDRVLRLEDENKALWQTLDALTAEIKELRLWQARGEQRRINVLDTGKWTSGSQGVNPDHEWDRVCGTVVEENKRYADAESWWQQELEACKPMIQELYHFASTDGSLHARGWGWNGIPVYQTACREARGTEFEPAGVEGHRYNASPASHDPIIFSET